MGTSYNCDQILNCPTSSSILFSRFVFKRFGSVLDLHSNELVLKHLGRATGRAVEPLYDLMSGHVGVELIHEGHSPPQVSQDTFELAKSGSEVVVDDSELRKKLSNLTIIDNRTHVTQLPDFCRSTVHFDLTKDDFLIRNVATMMQMHRVRIGQKQELII